MPRLLLVVMLVAAAAWMGIRYAVQDPDVPVTTYEVVPPGERDATVRLVRRAVEVITEESKPDRLYKRDAHAKPHGCVRAVMRVNPDIPERLRHGVFARPGHEYRAWVRYSNGTKANDREPDARGMAIKLLGVPGCKLLWAECDEPTQDFVMINYHTFFNRSVMDYEQFFDYQAEGYPFLFFLPPTRWHEGYHAINMVTQRVASPLGTRYYSMAAYKLGPHNIKFSAQPCDVAEEKAGAPRAFAASASGAIDPEAQQCRSADRYSRTPRGPNFLRAALVRHLDESCACFDFKVQLQDPHKHMPIEDPTIEWRTDDSPYRPVARLIVPKQQFNSDRQNQFCENLSYTPWHALPAHRPIGGLNRVRKAVYEAVSVRRHARNGIPRAEPTNWELPPTAGDAAPMAAARGSAKE